MHLVKTNKATREYEDILKLNGAINSNITT